MSVSNSKFLSRVEIDFNQQYNAVIGGRGTGKSSILEYLRWGLCDQPVDNTDSDIAPVQIKRKKLIEDTLQKFDGEVIVTFVLNEVKHIIKRNARTQEILLRIGDAAFVQATEKEVRNLFAVQAYSQKQLSSIGVRIEELKRFVELPIEQSLDQIHSDIRNAEAKIRTTYSNLIRKREIEAEMTKYNLEITSLTKQLDTLGKALKGLSTDDQEVIKQKTRYDNEDLIIENLKNELTRAKELVDTLKSEIGDETWKQDEDLDIQNTDLIKSFLVDLVFRFSGLDTFSWTLKRTTGYLWTILVTVTLLGDELFGGLCYGLVVALALSEVTSLCPWSMRFVSHCNRNSFNSFFVLTSASPPSG